MSKSNKEAKRTLILKYGAVCFIEELGLRSKEEVKKDISRYTSKKQRMIMDGLTYHHIIEKCKGGKATEENGALLRSINHIWFNRLPKEKQEEINKLFQQYKKQHGKQSQINFRIACAELNSQGIQQPQLLSFKANLEEPIVIPAFDMSKEEWEEYKAHKQKRNEKVFEKFRKAKERREDYER